MPPKDIACKTKTKGNMLFVMILVRLLLSLLFTWIFLRGLETGTWKSYKFLWISKMLCIILSSFLLLRNLFSILENDANPSLSCDHLTHLCIFYPFFCFIIHNDSKIYCSSYCLFSQIFSNHLIMRICQHLACKNFILARTLWAHNKIVLFFTSY